MKPSDFLSTTLETMPGNPATVKGVGFVTPKADNVVDAFMRNPATKLENMSPDIAQLEKWASRDKNPIDRIIFHPMTISHIVGDKNNLMGMVLVERSFIAGYLEMPDPETVVGKNAMLCLIIPEGLSIYLDDEIGMVNHHSSYRVQGVSFDEEHDTTFITARLLTVFETQLDDAGLPKSIRLPLSLSPMMPDLLLDVEVGKPIKENIVTSALHGNSPITHQVREIITETDNLLKVGNKTTETKILYRDLPVDHWHGPLEKMLGITFIEEGYMRGTFINVSLSKVTLELEVKEGTPYAVEDFKGVEVITLPRDIIYKVTDMREEDGTTIMSAVAL